jgi:hypothetical protein
LRSCVLPLFPSVFPRAVIKENGFTFYIFIYLHFTCRHEEVRRTSCGSLCAPLARGGGRHHPCCPVPPSGHCSTAAAAMFVGGGPTEELLAHHPTRLLCFWYRSSARARARTHARTHAHTHHSFPPPSQVGLV